MKELPRILLFSALVASTTAAQAHSTPSDLAEMSLEQLLAVEIDEQSGTLKSHRWQLSYQYNQLELGGYRDGTTELSDAAVLWAGPGTPRTGKNFPVLPTNIRQQVHLVRLSYQANAKTSYSVTLPWIQQFTDHLSIVPGYDAFRIDSKGIGDLKLSGNFRLPSQGDRGELVLTGGFSVPTGSIDEKGDTPRALGDQQLPYTMQLGSGTWDFNLGANWRSADESWHAAVNGVFRTGSNDRDYRLGNHYSGNLIRRFLISGGPEPYLGVEARTLDSIHGRDDEITVPNAFPYPASITNPDLYGGTSFSVLAGMEVRWRSSRWQLDGGFPVYQHLNGPQPQNRWKLSLKYSVTL